MVCKDDCNFINILTIFMLVHDLTFKVLGLGFLGVGFFFLRVSLSM